MPDLLPVSANVRIAENSTIKKVETAGAFAIGVSLRVDAADGKYYLTSNTITEDAATFAGISVLASSSSWAAVLTSGDIDLGVTLVPGMAYVVSGGGKISPATDSTSGDYVSHIGYAISTVHLRVSPSSNIILIP